MKSPVRAMLRKDSPLQDKVCDGIQALENKHKDYVDVSIRQAFADSLDLDKAVREDHEGENRWDYLLGHQASSQVIGLEPHSAKSDQVSTVIAKRKAALEQLRGHMIVGARVIAWCWVASGNVDFFPLEKAVLRLSQSGILFVGKKLHQKHLDNMVPAIVSPPQKSQKQGRGGR